MLYRNTQANSEQITLVTGSSIDSLVQCSATVNLYIASQQQ